MKEVVGVCRILAPQTRVVEAILNEIGRVEDSCLLDYTYDSYYNRLVVSHIGKKNSVLAASLGSAVKAIELYTIPSL